ncbi:MAG: cupin domain-containing protein [Rhodothermales bacterium]
MSDAESLLGGRNPEEFLREYWQKKPLLIRGALPGFTSPVTPEELANLACEEEVESRLILERGGDYPWQLRHGPFEEDDFPALPETHWSLLVQEVDRWVPEVADLLDRFSFIPNWRIDDVMVSYAPDAGSVGAHVDNYDVFLLQGLGRREWRIGTSPIDEEDLVPDLDVSMLSEFEPDATWILEPGDMLYLPPRLPHHGIAIGDCMTFSIGFRAPSREEVLAGFINQVLEEIDPLERYSDGDLKPQDEPGLISRSSLDTIRAFISDSIREEEIDTWFGRFVTEPKRADLVHTSERDWTGRELAQSVGAGASLERVAPKRMAFIRHDSGEVSLFAQGEEYLLDPDLAYAAPLLCGSDRLTAETLHDQLRDRDFSELLADLVNSGHLEISD